MAATFSVLNKPEQNKMAALKTTLSISSLSLYFADQNKSISKGENHYKSEHIQSFIFNQGVLKGEVRASMKKTVYKVTVSRHEISSMLLEF
jgi:hypothetical protein